MRRLTLSQAAYLAGFVDGEGSVSVQRMKHHGEHKAFTVTLRLYSTNKKVLEILRKRLSGLGSLQVQFRQNKKWKPLWRLHILSNQAITVLKSIKRYLLIKRKHAENAIAFQKGRKRGGNPINVQEKQRQNRHYQISKKLNKRGLK